MPTVQDLKNTSNLQDFLSKSHGASSLSSSKVILIGREASESYKIASDVFEKFAIDFKKPNMDFARIEIPIVNNIQTAAITNPLIDLLQNRFRMTIENLPVLLIINDQKVQQLQFPQQKKKYLENPYDNPHSSNADREFFEQNVEASSGIIINFMMESSYWTIDTEECKKFLKYTVNEFLSIDTRIDCQNVSAVSNNLYLSL